MLTTTELQNIAAGQGEPSRGDTVDTLLAKLTIQTSPAVSHTEITNESDFDFTEGQHYSVAIVSGTAIFSLPPVDEAPSVTVVLPAGIATGRFNSGTYVNVAAGVDSVLVIETYAA